MKCLECGEGIPNGEYARTVCDHCMNYCNFQQYAIRFFCWKCEGESKVVIPVVGDPEKAFKSPFYLLQECLCCREQNGLCIKWREQPVFKGEEA